MMPFKFAVVLVSAITTSFAQAEVYQWQDDLCDMQGEFDGKKYSAKQIKNSHEVFYGLTSTRLNSFFPPMNIQALNEISMSDMDKLNKEYEQVKANTKKFEVVPEAQVYKQNLLRSINSEYVLNKLVILSYLNPKEAITLSPPMCKHYIEPFLQNEAAVQKKWKQTVAEKIAEQSKFSDDGGEFYRNLATTRYHDQKAENPYGYARIDILTFGFGNCVNDQLYHADSEKVFSNSQKLNKTLFGNTITMQCEEP